MTMARANGDAPLHPSGRLRAAYFIYQIAAHLLVPVMLGVFLWRSRKEPLYRARLGERFGFIKPRNRGAIWIFAASLGETRAVSPLIRELHKRGYRCLLTHSSPAGLTEGKRLFADLAEGVEHGYVPLDLFWALRLFLHRAAPRALLVVESELWPAQLLEAQKASIPTIQVNGNLLQRTINRDQKILGGVRLDLLRMFNAILTKSQTHRERYLKAGVAPERIKLVGELKFDQQINLAQTAGAARIRDGWVGTGKALLLASTVEEEEDQLVEMVTGLLAQVSELKVIWVPRSPQRFEGVAAKLARNGQALVCRSSKLSPDLSGHIGPDTRILIGDSIGEMDFYYCLSDLVFVGATIADHGGHNVVEPLMHGLPVVTGPSLYGITFPAEDAIAQGAMQAFDDAGALGRAIKVLVTDDGRLRAFTDKAKAYGQAHVGAAQRSADVIEGFL